MTPSTLVERRPPEPPHRLLPLRTAPSRVGSTISSNASHLVPDRLQGFDLSFVHLCQKFREPSQGGTSLQHQLQLLSTTDFQWFLLHFVPF